MNKEVKFLTKREVSEEQKRKNFVNQKLKNQKPLVYENKSEVIDFTEISLQNNARNQMLYLQERIKDIQRIYERMKMSLSETDREKVLKSLATLQELEAEYRKSDAQRVELQKELESAGAKTVKEKMDLLTERQKQKMTGSADCSFQINE